MSATVLEPEYIRPAQVREKFNIGRSQVYELIAQGKIKSHVLRKKGNTKGMRLISVESLRSYIEAQPQNVG